MTKDLILGIKEVINKNLLLINAIDEEKDENGISQISQKALAEKIGLSPTLVSKRIKLLIAHGAVVKIKSGHYRVLDKNSVGKFLLLDTLKVWFLVNEQPEILKNYKKNKLKF